LSYGGVLFRRAVRRLLEFSCCIIPQSR